MKNWKGHITLVLLLFLGFLLTPNLSYACSKIPIKTEHHKSLKKHVTKTVKEDCCKTRSCENHPTENDCNGKCKDSSCRYDYSSFSVFLSNDLKIYFPFDVVEKHLFEFIQSYYSFGHYSIWQPPKIS